MTQKSKCLGLGVLLACLFISPSAFAEDKAAGGGGGDLAKAVQNPVGALISVPFKFSVDFGAPDGSAYFLNLQPVIPVTVGDVNIINRIIFPLVAVDGFIAGTPEIPEGYPGDGASGIGDTNYTPYFSPANPGSVIWGIGPSIMMPTATDDQLGSGKWSGGISAVALTQPKPWTVGALVRQLWSFAGDSDRADVNQFLFEPFVNYNLDNGWYLVSDMILTANWDVKQSQRWTVPVGGGFGKLFKIGEQPINSRIEAYYNVVVPDAGPEWTMSFTLQFLFPK